MSGLEMGLHLDDAALVEAALEEDVGQGDWTTRWTVSSGTVGRAVVLAKAPLVVAGTQLFREVYHRLDPSVSVAVLAEEGDRVEAGTRVAELEGPAGSILTGERTALNFLGRLSGIATLTRSFVEAVGGTGARILDTRKTTPGWRRLEKAAVRAGGGWNHRMGLHDMVLVKENHIALAGGVRAALRKVAEANTQGLPVEVEVRSLAELEELGGMEVDRVLLDNFSLEELRVAVEGVRAWASPHPQLEASGNVSLDRVRAVAQTGVGWISVGALTHSAPVADYSLLMEEGL